MKTLIEGIEMLEEIPKLRGEWREPIVHLENGLILDGNHCLENAMAIIGASGSGKSTLLENIMEPILDYTERAGDAVVIFAAKPSFRKYLRPGDIEITIDSDKPESCLNFFEELKESENPELTIQEIAHELFAEQKKNTNQPFFPEAASILVGSTMKYLYDYAKRTGEKLSNAELIDFLVTTPVHGNEEIYGWLELAEREPAYFGCAKDLIGDGSGEQGIGVLSEFHLLAQRMYGSFSKCDGIFSPSKFVREGKKRVILYFNYAKAAHSALSMFKVILQLIMKQSLDSENKHPVWLFLDEFSLLPNLGEVLFDVASYGRDPSGCGRRNGCRLLLCLQSVQLLTRNYSNEQVQALLSVLPNVIEIGNIPDVMSRKILSDRYGTARYQYRVGANGHYIDCVESVVNDFHFSKNGRGQCIMSIPGLSNCPFLYNGWRES